MRGKGGTPIQPAGRAASRLPHPGRARYNRTDVHLHQAAADMRAVILAAGDGGRLGDHTAATPKPLVPLRGRRLIDYTLAALADAGIRDVVVVTGYREGQVIDALCEGVDPRLSLTFVSNPCFEGQASLSLRAARRTCADAPFLLTMADHVLSSGLVTRLLSAAGGAAPGTSFVAADSALHSPDYTDEATKLSVAADGFVLAIGKRIANATALDAGAFVLAPEAWAAVDAVAEDCELSVIFSELARRRLLRAADVSGEFWYDIDTAEDLAAAAEILGAATSEPHGL